jgi:hypothetical protein
MLAVFFSASSSTTDTSEIVLVGSTPGDKEIKDLLSIPSNGNIDFIRWNLKLNNAKTNQNSFFKLDIAFGETKPNTLGFTNGGEKRSYEGTIRVSKNKNSNMGSEIYHLKSPGFSNEISIIKISENLFHLLTSQNELMVGNGGWSYSLNRKDPVGSNIFLISSSVSDHKLSQLVFEGRTPCQEIANEHPEMNTSRSCFKLKWKLTLNWDSANHLPTIYTIRKVVDNKPNDVSGKWTIIKGSPTNPETITYKIEPDQPDESISFLVADDNILFFLGKNGEHYSGNENFSFVLNRKSIKP